MKRLTASLSVLTFCFVFAAGAFASNAPKANLSSAQWKAFSKNLVTALASDNQGLKLGAMQQIIRYGDQLDVQDAVFDVMRLYRDSKDENVRRMAVVTLGSMKNGWAMGFLERAQYFEQSQALQKTIRDVLVSYHAEKVAA